MTREQVVRFVAGGALGLLVLASPPIVSAQYAVFDADSAMRDFHERVDTYAALHRRLAPSQEALSSQDSLAKLLTGQYLASAIRASRRNAQQGEIFSPEIATLFRWMLADAIDEFDGEQFLARLNGGEPVPRGMHPTVNEPYTMLPVHRLPVDVRLALPPIPAELDYRLAGHDLLLWDIYAGIVIDFVPNAITSRVATE